VEDSLSISVSQAGTEIGVLKLLESPPKNREGEPSENEYSAKQLELVEIAEGYRSDTHTGMMHEHYRVMWIERKGTVTYRKGLGEVNKEAWDAQDRVLIDMMLG
jgi:hypothetical protein